MELELATTKDIVQELHRRRMKFVMIGVENTNLKKGNFCFLSGNANRPDEFLTMIEFGKNELLNRGDPGSASDGEFSEL